MPYCPQLDKSYTELGWQTAAAWFHEESWCSLDSIGPIVLSENKKEEEKKEQVEL